MSSGQRLDTRTRASLPIADPTTLSRLAMVISSMQTAPVRGRSGFGRISRKRRGAGPPKRPLNSWMAFRSFYSPIFRAVQQKEISSFVKQLWDSDPYKAKWAIVAKAYAMIRASVSRDEARLHDFLEIVQPHCGMLSRDEYLPTMGWTLTATKDSSKPFMLQRLFVPDPGMVPTAYRTTEVSAEELVSICVDEGFVDEQIPPPIPTPMVHLAMASQPMNVAVDESTSPSQRVDQSDPVPNNMVSPAQQPQAATSRISHGIDFGNNGRNVRQGAQRVMFQSLRDGGSRNNIAGRRRNEPMSQRRRVERALRANNNLATGLSANYRQVVHDSLFIAGDQDLDMLFDPLAEQEFPTLDPLAGPDDSVFAVNDLGTYIAPPNLDDPASFSSLDFLNGDIEATNFNIASAEAVVAEFDRDFTQWLSASRSM